MARGRKKNQDLGLAQREQQILDLLYQQGASSAKQIEVALDDKLNNSTIRTILRILEQKGYVKHHQKSREYIYSPVENKHKAADGLFDKMVDTFFSGSVSDAMATFIDRESKNMDDSELDELMAKIKQAKQAKADKS